MESIYDRWFYLVTVTTDTGLWQENLFTSEERAKAYALEHVMCGHRAEIRPLLTEGE
jgi:hypothetical protein